MPKMTKRLALLLAAVVLQSCTTVSYTTTAGTKFSVRKFTPFGGEELSIDGTLEGIGALAVNKKTEDSRETAQALLDGLIDAATP